MIINKHGFAMVLFALYFFGQLASAHSLFVEPQTLLETPSEASAEDDFSFEAPFQIENVSDSQAIFSYLTPGEIDVYEFEVTPQEVAGGRPVLVTASALPPACQETVNNYPVTVLMGPGLPSPSVDLPFDVPPGMGVIVANNPKVGLGEKRPIFDMDFTEPLLNLGIGWFLPQGITQDCLLNHPYLCDFSNSIALPVFVPGIYNIIVYDPAGKAQDYTANIGSSEENRIPNSEVEDLIRDNNLLHTACSETFGEVFGLTVSTDANRSDPLPLKKQTLSGNVYISFSPLFPQLEIRKVKFFLDGRFIKTEWYAPYDLTGTRYDGTATSIRTNNLENGSHRLRAKIILASGDKFTVRASFKVLNPSHGHGYGHGYGYDEDEDED
jgi:hypothetical protein